jgi:predicted TIM-barrel fold metal-dependent hydrolase
VLVAAHRAAVEPMGSAAAASIFSETAARIYRIT